MDYHDNRQRHDGAEPEPLYPEYIGLKPIELARIQKQLTDDLDILSEQKTEKQKRLDFVRQNMLPTAMDNEGIEKFTIEGVGTVYLASDMWVKVLSSPELLKWLANNGHADLIKETVNPSSLKSAVKQMLSKGEVIPESIIKITPYTRACILSK